MEMTLETNVHLFVSVRDSFLADNLTVVCGTVGRRGNADGGHESRED